MNRGLSIATLSCLICQPLQAETWQAVTGASALEQLVSGATAHIELREGVTAVGTYNADGTAAIEAWGETFQRSWEVVGDDRVCFSSFNETNCHTFEQNLDDPQAYRATHTETNEIFVFRVSGSDPAVVTRESLPSSEGGPNSPTAAEIAAELSNPNTNLGSMNMVFDYVAYDGDLPGAGSQSAIRGTFQPSLPYALSPTTNLFARPGVPVIFSQDVPNAKGGFDSKGLDLGDITFDAMIVNTFMDIGMVLGAGVVGTLPTATDDALGLDQWLLGPEAIAAVVREWGVFGALVTHQWDVAGEDDFDTSITGGQYFYAFNLKDGWQLNAAPTYSYNHEADSGNRWTLPLAIGASKTTMINGRPWKFGLQYWHYVESPDLYGPDWQIRFTVSPVLALPW
jgi:hypothetical protein